MASSLESLVACGTKLWLDSIDPDLVRSNRALGATGATSNPIIVSDLLKTGRFDDQLQELMAKGLDDHDVAWQMTDKLVQDAQDVFRDVWQATHGNDGYVSFELDPLLEDVEQGPAHDVRVSKYVELGKQWSAGHQNRMIKIPATPAGLDAIAPLTAAGVTLNVTLIFTSRQYEAARNAMWKGAQQRSSLDNFKSVYSIFVSRVDVYAQKHCADLSQEAQQWVGIVNAKRIWKDNQAFWEDKGVKLQQEMIFASTGTKNPEDDPGKYVKAFAGSDIETNPPATNDAVQASGHMFQRQIDQLPPQSVLDEIDAKVNFEHLEQTLMEEGLKKFADPQKGLLALIGEKRTSLV
ncbi:MAG: transaldolase family protein [Pirellulaceae bacterium]